MARCEVYLIIKFTISIAPISHYGDCQEQDQSTNRKEHQQIVRSAVVHNFWCSVQLLTRKSKNLGTLELCSLGGVWLSDPFQISGFLFVHWKALESQTTRFAYLFQHTAANLMTRFG
jgi:hypothetical protein